MLRDRKKEKNYFSVDYFWFKDRPRFELADRAHLNLKPSAVRPRTPLNLPLNGINAVDQENLPDHPNKPRDRIFTHRVAWAFFDKFRRYHSTVLRRVKKNQSEKVEKVGRVYLGQ
jgi:hypothetical protein